MIRNDTTVLADAERLAHWACRTLKSDRTELRTLLRSWREVSNLTLPNSLIGELADLVAAQYPTTIAKATDTRVAA